MGRRGLAVWLAAFMVPLVLHAPPAAAEVPTPTVEEIPYGVGVFGHPLWDPWFDIEAFGYESHEYLVSGTATATGGTQTADYTTRIIVVHPTDPADFSGTVMLDWVNVTAQFENAVNSLTSVRYLLREGWTWVHVSAQAAGVCCTPLTPKVYDPVRYEALDHPGDEYANDMFSQIAKVFEEPGPVDPLRGLQAEVILAAGQSQSANRLTDYVQTRQQAAGIIDGFLIQAEGDKVYPANPDVPVIHVLGEREGDPEEPTEWPNYVLWEVAGAAHADSWIGRQQTEGQRDRLGSRERKSREEAEALWQSAGNMGEEVDPRSTVCIVNGALFPTRFAVNAALDHLERWGSEGIRPPVPPRYEFEDGSVARDADRNALGGLRLPPIDVPIAHYDSAACNLGGITVPFAEVDLIQRYGDHQSYYDRFAAATTQTVAAGYLLPTDAEELLARACAARPRFLDTSTEPCAASVTDGDPPDGPAPAPDPPASPPPPSSLPTTGGGVVALALLLAAMGSRRRSR
ncbi:MAG: hypothetical protein KY469_11300 [Actinobacteria bacterium]|nr:hypothetical protein [Actinomycetota bacterium]